MDIPATFDSALLYNLAAGEIGVPMIRLRLLLDGAFVPFGKDLATIGIHDGSVLTAKVAEPTKGPSILDIPATVPPDQLLAMTRDDPALLDEYHFFDPELGEALTTGDITKVRSALMKKFLNHHHKIFAEEQKLKAAEADPDNPENQKIIEEAIRKQNIQANKAAALENLPEAFAAVTMLYVNIEVNNFPIKAFVDSGAQTTTMSKACAERCGITRLIDTNYSGVTRGVGMSRTVGRIHIAQMKFGNYVFPISISVIESSTVDFLLGLDALRRYRCCIDLHKNVLRIDVVDGTEEIPFLPESELPSNTFK
eukprot:scaffold437_cov168-Ochromonas_danica.AAC.11